MNAPSERLAARTTVIVVFFMLCAAAIGAQEGQGEEPAGSDLVFVEGGTFTMGTAGSTKAGQLPHKVTVSPFYMAAREVTVAEYAEFTKDLGGMTYLPRFLLDFGRQRQKGQVWNGKEYEIKDDATWDNPYLTQEDDHPVVLVVWNDAAQYCNWLSLKEGLEEVYQADSKINPFYLTDFSKNGYRLPTEAEWEWAARGGLRSKRYRYIGSTSSPFETAWLGKGSNMTTHPVGKKKPNELGVYDLSGNAFEWCNDWFGDYSSDPAVDPSGPNLGKSKVIRGGSWLSDPVDAQPETRCDSPPDCGFNDLGFRVVRASGPGTSKPFPPPTTTTTTTTTLPAKPTISKGFLEMVAVEGGSFVMGTAGGPENTKPAHEVVLDSFHIGKYEVTVEQFAKFVQVKGYRTTAETEGGGYVYEQDQWVRKSDATWKNPYLSQVGLNPVVHISYWDAAEFCNALSEADGLTPVYDIAPYSQSANFSKNGYRLPTEAEWEYAARGGKLSKGFTYSGSNDLGSVAWFGAKKAVGGTHAVGGKEPNELGIYDMSGNVLEWCADRYAPYTAEKQNNPSGSNASEMKYVLRGGSWTNGTDACSVFYRIKDAPEGTDYTFGFRVVTRP
ncbi:MAG: SUMF1/EgtB/PvdO family nonheme iron enzyme [Spirochaetes bacterium]|nr:SUMF1/EgtB/PvdO family nonheme iron enzyme [Spirochaetota bacterium]